MPYDDPEPDDPNVLVGVVLPGSKETVYEMAIAFADEFAQLGFDAAHLLQLFHQPYYAGAHQALQVLGEEAIREVVRESTAFWGQYRVVIKEETCPR